MCDKSHFIKVLNIENGATVTHALLLIHGRVGNRCEAEKITIERGSSLPEDEILNSKADFKHLARLSAGENTFRISYCNTRIRLNIRLEESPMIFQVIPLYIICAGHDGHFQSPERRESSSPAVACRRIDVMLQMTQLVYAEKLNETQYGRKCFKIGENCRPFHSELLLEKALALSEQELWDHFAEEVIRREGEKVKTRKYVAILGCTTFEGISNGDFSYEAIKRRTRARAAIGGGGLVVFGTACLYTWPDRWDDAKIALQNLQKVEMSKFADDSNYRRTFGGCFATNLGSLCHELGHVMDLGHTEDGIMGRSFDAVDKMFVNGDVERGEGGGVKVLPKRSFQPNPNSSRFTAVKTSGSVLKDYLKEKECNGVYFTENCIAILAHHKWLNGGNCSGIEDPIGFNKQKRLVATNGDVPLRLVELREVGTEMVRHYWSLKGREFEFTLPHSVQLDRPWVLFAIDQEGNSMKCSTAD